jgi:hypothetical protein
VCIVILGVYVKHNYKEDEVHKIGLVRVWEGVRKRLVLIRGHSQGVAYCSK